MILLALGAGWAANQDWRWSPLALLDWRSEPEVQEAAPDTVADTEGQPKAEEPQVATVADQPGAAPSAAGSSGARAEAEPAATDPAPATEQAAREPAPAGDRTEPAGDRTEDAAASEQARQPQTPSVAEPDRASGPAEAAVAAIEPSSEPPDEPASGETQGAGTAGDEGAGVARATGAVPREARETSEQEQAGDAPSSGADAEVVPSFDIVRVEPDGRAVIAGRAAPGAEVEVRSGEQVIDRVRASRRGEWVAIPAKPLEPGDRQLTAVAKREGAAPVESDQVVAVAVPGPTSATTATAAAAETGAPAEQPVAVLLARDGKGTGRILQAPGRLSAEGTLALMTVSYDEAGKVLLSGEAPPGVPVRIYVDNRPAALVVGDAKGAWQAGLDESLQPGTYTLRLDQLDGEGQTVARLETPFTRVSEPPVEGEIQVDYVVVQPGNSLWRIARRLSGKGLDYVHIYDANETQIRDPDLIYPGQVFEIPAALGSAG